MQGSDGSIGYANHSAIGAHYAARLGFPRAVSGAVGMHVAAKRASHEPAYMGLLSKASVETLAQQGGAMAPDELAAFMSRRAGLVAMRLRKYDDAGKERGAPGVPELDSYRPLLVETLARAAASPAEDDYA